MDLNYTNEIRARVLERMDLSREMSDEEIEELIGEETCRCMRAEKFSVRERVRIEQKVFNSLRKLDAFEMNQLLIGRDVLLLHESSSAPLNTRVLDCYIQEYLV